MAILNKHMDEFTFITFFTKIIILEMAITLTVAHSCQPDPFVISYNTDGLPQYIKDEN